RALAFGARKRSAGSRIDSIETGGEVKDLQPGLFHPASKGGQLLTLVILGAEHIDHAQRFDFLELRRGPVIFRLIAEPADGNQPSQGPANCRQFRHQDLQIKGKGNDRLPELEKNTGVPPLEEWPQQVLQVEHVFERLTQVAIYNQLSPGLEKRHQAHISFLDVWSMLQNAKAEDLVEHCVREGDLVNAGLEGVMVYPVLARQRVLSSSFDRL